MQYIQKPGGEKVTLKSQGFATLQDAGNQGWSPVSAPEAPTSTASPPEPPITTNEPITTDQITNVGQTEEVFGESKRQADVYIPNRAALDKYTEAGLTDKDIRYEGGLGTDRKMYIRSDSEFYKTQMPPRELAEAPPPVETEEEAAPKLTALEEKEQLAQTYLTDKAAFRTEAKAEAGVNTAQMALNEGMAKANEMMSTIETMQADKNLQDILNEETKAAIKDSIEGQGRGIPLSIIRGQIAGKTAEITREQRLDELMDVYKINTTINQYNSQLRANQLLQGNYTDALDTYKTMMTDYAELKAIEFDILEDKGQLEKDERERLESEVAYEQSLALEKGLVHISSTEEYNAIVKEMGVTADTFNNFFYKDPTNDKIYLRTSGGDEYLTVSEATTLGVPYGTTVKQAMNMGITPARWKGTSGEATGIEPIITTEFQQTLEDTATALASLRDEGKLTDLTYNTEISSLMELYPNSEKGQLESAINDLMEGKSVSTQTIENVTAEDVANDWLTEIIQPSGEEIYKFGGTKGVSLQERAEELITSLKRIEGFSNKDIILEARKQLKNEGYNPDEVNKILPKVGLGGFLEKIGLSP